MHSWSPEFVMAPGMYQQAQWGLLQRPFLLGCPLFRPASNHTFPLATCNDCDETSRLRKFLPVHHSPAALQVQPYSEPWQTLNTSKHPAWVEYSNHPMGLNEFSIPNLSICCSYGWSISASWVHPKVHTYLQALPQDQHQHLPGHQEQSPAFKNHLQPLLPEDLHKLWSIIVSSGRPAIHSQGVLSPERPHPP